MSLSQKDLQSIRIVLREEVRGIVRDEVQTEIRKEIAPLKKDMGELKKAVSLVIETLDRRLITLAQRVLRVENYLHL